MFPKELHLAEGKDFWANADCFSDDAFHFVSAFLHTDYKIGMHSHEFYEINIVVRGKGCHYIEKSSLSVREGDVFVIPPGILHGYYCEGGLDVYHVLVKNDFIKRYRDELEGTPGFKVLFDIEPYLRQFTGEKYFPHFEYGVLAEIRKVVGKIHEAGEAGRYIYQDVMTLNLICRLCEEIISNTSEKTGVSAEIIKVMEYIKDNLEEKLTIGELAGICNMSKSTFGRQFKKMIGITPMEYVIACRTERAKLLIEESTLNKAEIAQHCGFYDTSHMDKYIKGGDHR